jgi:O-antigen/teichoic acid export membrane protein
MPTKNDFKSLFKEIFSISMAIYLVKIIYTNWEKFGSNVLGMSLSTEVIAMYAFALLYAKKLTNISDSVTSVNLPVLSEEYVNDHRNYRSLFTKNFNKVFSLIMLTGAFSSYWAPTLIRILVGGTKYDASFAYIPQLILAFVMYSFINIVNSSVLIPAKLTKTMITSFALLIIGTAGVYFGFYSFDSNSLGVMSWAMAFGGLLAFAYMVWASYKKIKLSFFNIDHLAILVQFFAVAWLCSSDSITIKAIFFPVFLGLMIWSVLLAKFLQMSDFKQIWGKVKSFKLRKAN